MFQCNAVWPSGKNACFNFSQSIFSSISLEIGYVCAFSSVVIFVAVVVLRRSSSCNDGILFFLRTMENYTHANNGFFFHTLSTPNFFLSLSRRTWFRFGSQAFYCVHVFFYSCSSFTRLQHLLPYITAHTHSLFWCDLNNLLLFVDFPLCYGPRYMSSMCDREHNSERGYKNVT